MSWWEPSFAVMTEGVDISIIWRFIQTTAVVLSVAGWLSTVFKAWALQSHGLKELSPL